MEIDIKTSDELREILKSSRELAKKLNQKEISVSNVFYNIFSFYFYDKGEDKRIIEWINKVMGKDVNDDETYSDLIENFLKDLYFIVENSLPVYTIPSEFVGKDVILNEDLRLMFESVQKMKGIIEDSTNINTIELIILLHYTKSNVKELISIQNLFDKYRFNVEDLVDSIGSNLGKNKETDKENNNFSSFKSLSPSVITPDQFEDMVKNTPKSFSEDEFEKAGESEAISGVKFDPESKTPYLDQFAFPMSSAVKCGEYDPVVGRDREISQIVEILCCRKKNNAVLLGDPGCGKTAVVEGLVQRINSGNVPDELKDKKVYSLDLNGLVSGTKYRGEYEQRLQEIIKEVRSNSDIIVYVDEFHNLVGNGGSNGNGDAANILKPYLARGEFQCIGSTTVDEYRKFIEKDGALKRRFQNVMIEEPNIEETITILKGIAKKYSEYHRVVYSDSVIESCVYWSKKYITDRFFPDKAIDCLDMAGSFSKLKNPLIVDKSNVDKYEKEIDELNSEMSSLIVEKSNYEKAIEISKKKRALLAKLEKERKSLENNKENQKNWPKVTENDVAEVISKISKIPVDKITRADTDKLKQMKSSLESKVIGQSEAVEQVTLSLQRNFLGLRDETKPIASLLFVGPTGTGKSLICKEIAKEFFGSEKALIRFDMGEFGERHEVTKLTGSTASYVGYDDTPLLEQVRRKPYSVVLFDEIEKAAPEIYNIFLNILDEGNVTLGNGTKVDFKNTIIIFTGNIGTKELILKGAGMGFSKLEGDSKKKSDYDTVIKAVKKQFKPEFINRLSSITVFNELSKDNLNDIFELELSKLSSRLNTKGYSLEVSPELKEKIISECDMKYGARDLQRNITKFIENEICNSMLKVKSMTNVELIQVSLDRTKKEVKVKFLKTPKVKSLVTTTTE